MFDLPKRRHPLTSRLLPPANHKKNLVTSPPSLSPLSLSLSPLVLSCSLSLDPSPRVLCTRADDSESDAAKKTKSAGDGEKKVRVLGVIPARYGSTRFPAKPLALIG